MTLSNVTSRTSQGESKWDSLRARSVPECEGSGIARPHFPSKLQLDSALKEERFASCPEAIQNAVTGREFKTDVVGQVPVHHGRDALKRAAANVLRVEIGV